MSIPDKIYVEFRYEGDAITTVKITEQDVLYIRADKIKEILEMEGQKARNEYMKTKKKFDGGYAIAFDDIEDLIFKEARMD